MLFVLAGLAGAAPESAGPRVVSVDLRGQGDEGAYYVVFFKRGPWPGHAFVGLGTEDPGAAQSKFKAFGLYPLGGLPAAAASWVVGEVPASLVDETRHGSLRAVTDQLICRVGRTSYDAAERVRADWVASTALPSEAPGAEGYELLRQDCVTFTAEIARAIALKVPPRSRTKYPQDLIDELIAAATEAPATLPTSPPPAEVPLGPPLANSGILEGTWGGAIGDGDLGKKRVSDATVTLGRAPDGTWSGEFAMVATHRGISERLQLTLSRGVATTAGLHFPPGQSVTRSESSPLGTESKTMTDETSTHFTLEPDGRLRVPFQDGFSFLLSRRLPDGTDARRSSVEWTTLAPGESASIGSVRFDFLGFRRSGRFLCACGRITNLSDSRVLKGSRGMSMFTGSQFIGFRFGDVKDEFGNDVPQPGGFSEADYYETLGALGLAKVVRDFYLKRDENTSNGLMPGQSWADFALIGSPLVQKAISFSMPCEVETLQGTARLIMRFTRNDMMSAKGAVPTSEAPSAPRTTAPAPSAPAAPLVTPPPPSAPPATAHLKLTERLRGVAGLRDDPSFQVWHMEYASTYEEVVRASQRVLSQLGLEQDGWSAPAEGILATKRMQAHVPITRKLVTERCYVVAIQPLANGRVDVAIKVFQHDVMPGSPDLRPNPGKSKSLASTFLTRLSAAITFR